MACTTNIELPLAPTLQPSEDEFSNPIEYIRKVVSNYRHTGIVKICPPASWKPQSIFNGHEFSFRPRLQRIHELNALFRVRKMFDKRLGQLLNLQGLTYQNPVLDGCFVDMHKLYQEVKRRGGMSACAKSGLWPEVCNVMQIDAGHLERVKRIYKKTLISYELHEKRMTENRRKNNEKKGSQPNAAKRRRVLDSIEIENLLCSVCNFGHKEDSMLLCGKCNKGTHMDCMSPPFTKIPQGEWHCDQCIDSILERQPPTAYGFKHSNVEYTLDSFQDMADKFERSIFRRKPHSLDDKERSFWSIVNNRDRHHTVMYGSDLSTLTHPYGFPFKDDAGKNGVDQQAAQCQWNLKNLPSLPGSALSFIDGQVSGVNVPWLYIGMLYSAFCWHTEDHWSYSVSYLHRGSAKTWYGIPGEHAELFESVFEHLAPELLQFQPDLMHQLVTLVDPQLLKSYNVPVYKLRQEAGEFVVTFPRCYHAGFNNGFNCAEAVNVCPADWIPYGRLSIGNYAMCGRLCVFAHDELMFKIAMENRSLSAELKQAVAKDLQNALWCERGARNELSNVKNNQQMLFEFIDDDNRQCSVCCTTLFLSCLKCNCSQGNLICLKDARKMSCSCKTDNCILKYRFTLEEMEQIIEQFLRRKVEA